MSSPATKVLVTSLLTCAFAWIARKRLLKYFKKKPYTHECKSDKPRGIHSVTVFCGSRTGVNPAFAEATAKLAAEFARRKLKLVYGGGTVGLMGVMARGVNEDHGDVLGIIPRSLAPREVSGDTIGTTVVTKDMHTRKALMARHADAFIALPGGFGTYEELFEVITWQQLGIHIKPIGVLNVAGYFDPFLQMIHDGVKENFIDAKYLDMVVSAADPAELLDKLMRHTPPAAMIRWIDLDES